MRGSSRARSAKPQQELFCCTFCETASSAASELGTVRGLGGVMGAIKCGFVCEVGGSCGWAKAVARGHPMGHA